MSLFAHHTGALFQIEINGQPFPSGMAEHTIAFGLTALAVALIAYGASAALRDLLKWRRRKTVALQS